MPPATPLPNTFNFRYDAATNRLIGHWPTCVGDTHLRTHYANLLAAACAHGNCCFWLLDMRERNWHTPGFGQWFCTVFAQAVQHVLRQSVFIAYIIGPAYRKLANTPGTQAMQRGSTAHGVYPIYFDSETAAQEWLTHQQSPDKQ